MSKLLLAICILALPAALPAQVMSFAGLQSTLPVTGLAAPIAIALDAAGNRYIVSHLLPNVIEISASGNQTTIPVSLSDPRAIAVDSAGNLYIADYQKTYIVEIPATGGSVIQLGNNMAHPSSVVLDSAGNVYIAETGHTRILKVAAGGSPQTVVGAGVFTFINPVGLAVDSNSNLYVSDIGAQSLIEVTFSGSLASEATLLSGLSDQPYDVAFVNAGEILLSGGTSQQLTMHRVPAGVGVASPVYQLGTGLVDPAGIAVDAAGNVYVADQAAPAIDMIAPGPVNLGQANLCPTAGIQAAPCSQTLTLNFNVASGASLTSLAVAVVTQGGQQLDFTTVNSGSGCTGTITGPATCSIPVVFSPLAPGIRLGSVEVTGIAGSSPSAGSLASVPLYGLGLGPRAGLDAGAIDTLPLSLGNSASPSSVLTDSSGSLYLVDNAACVVKKLLPGATTPIVVAGSGTCGSPSGSLGPATSAVFEDPWRIALNGRGDLYISDDQASVIWKVDALTQIITTVAGRPGTPGYTSDGVLAVTASLDTPYALALDGAGDLYFSDYHDQTVRRIDATTGVLSTVAGQYTAGAGYSGDGGAATSAQLHNPIGLAFDSSGNFYIVDAGNQVIREVTAATGIISTVAGTAGTAGYSGDNGVATSAELSNPEGIAVDPAGNLYIADAGNFAVRKVSDVPFSSTVSAGAITTIVGTASGNAQYTGDGGAANLAGVSDVADLALDGSGNLYLADTSNHVIREVTSGSGVVNFLSGNIGVSSPAIDVVISNTGNSPLTLSALMAATGFSLAGEDTTCTASTILLTGAGCTLGLEFTPAALGAMSGTVTLTDDSGNNPTATQSLAVSGTATIASSQLAFGFVPATLAPGSNLGTIPVSVESSSGAVVTTSTANVTVTVSGPSSYSQTVTAAAASGVASVDLAGLPLAAPGTYTLAATSAGLTSATAQVIVVPPATQLAVSGIPSAITAGGNLGTATVSVEDATGTVITSSTASVTIAITGPGGYSQTVSASAVNGIATLNLSGLVLTTVGSYTVTTSSQYLPNKSSTVTVSAATFILTPSGGSGGTAPTQTIAAGAAATYTITLAATSATFALPATFTVSGLPTGATATFSPATLTPGPSMTTTTLTIQTAASVAALHRPGGIGAGLGGIALGLLLLPVAAARRLRKAAGRLPMPVLLLGLLLAGAVCGLAGCSGNNAKSLTPTPTAETYTLTVSATSGSTSGSTTVTLVVQ